MINLTKTKKTTSTLFIVLTMAISGLTGCAKDRPDFNDPANASFQEISELDGKEFELTTLSAISDTPMFSDAVSVSADISGTSINSNFTIVSYETNLKHFDDVPIFGLPGQKYKLRYKITDKFLMVYKIAKPELIPFSERTSATKEGEFVAVPILGYPLQFRKKRRFKNLDDEFTNQFRFDVVDTLSEATHVLVDYQGKQLFDIEKKLNVLPVSFFAKPTRDSADKAKIQKMIEEDHAEIDKLRISDDKKAIAKEKLTKKLEGKLLEWYYSATIVGAPPSLANSIGRDVTADFSQGSVSRIRFIKAESALMGVNLNIDDEIDTTDENNLEVIVRIPVEWLDFRRGKNNVNTLTEEVLNNNHIESKNSLNRDYIKADFTQVTTAASGGFDTSFSNDFSLYDLEMSENYFSFVTENSTTKIRTRYSFRLAEVPKRDSIKRYFKDDRNIFGFFTTELNKLNNHTQIREEDREKNVLINHYMPEADANGKKKIVYHFSKLTKTQSMRDVGRIAVDVWNQAFEKAGTGVEIALDESKDVNLGDLRYNIINVVDSKNGGNLLGYGPTIADTDTGEIIAGSSNIYADPFREMLFRDIRNYVRARRGLFAPHYLGNSRPPGSLLGGSTLDRILEFTSKLYNGIEENPLMLTNRILAKRLAPTKRAHEAYKSEMLRLKGLKGKMKIPHFVLEVDRTHNKLMREHNLTEADLAGFNQRGVSHHGAFESASKDIIKEIELRCKEDLDEYIAELEKDDVIFNDREDEVILKCINKRGTSNTKSIHVAKEDISLLESRVLSTLVHEMGHNFSLRHNFLASTDNEHYSKDEDGNVLSKSSSVMDYNRGNVDELLAPAKYDIEAIRFLYGDAVTLKNGENQPIVKTKPLLAQLKDLNVNRLTLKFCTDEHASYNPLQPWTEQTDPLCARHDHGENPLDIVKENITSVNSFIAMRGYRYDLAFGPSGDRVSSAIVDRNLITLHKIYSQWRFHLAAFVGDENRYLESYTEAQFQEQIQKMKTDKDPSGEPSIHAKNFADYYEASEEAYKFLKDMAFNTAKYCLFQGTEVEGGSELFEFEKLQNAIYRDKNVTVQACTDEVIAEWAKTHYTDESDAKKVTDIQVRIVNPVRDGVTLNGFGEYVNDIKETLDPRSQDFTKINIAGLEMTRRLSFVLLTLRAPLMFHLDNKNFVPNFLDRQKYMDEIGGLLLDRSINGITNNNAKFPGVEGQFQYLKFVRENVNLAEQTLMFRQGLANPDNPDASQRRLGATQVYVTQDSSIIPPSFLQFNIGGTFIAASPDAALAGPIIRKRIELAAQQRVGQGTSALPEVVPAAEIIKFVQDNKLADELPSIETISADTLLVQDLINSCKSYMAKSTSLSSDANKKFIDTLAIANGPFVLLVQAESQLPPEVLQMKASAFFGQENIIGLFNQNFPSQMRAARGNVLPIFAKESLPAIIDVGISDIANVRNMREDYVRNREDRDAQLNLLTDVLLRFGGQRGIL